MKIPFILPVAAIMGIMASCTGNTDKTQVSSADTSSANPLLKASTLPLQAPPFDKIKDADFKPALVQGMTEQIAEMDKIANNTEAPTFENTLVAMEKSGELLTRANRVFNVLTGANTDSVLQKLQEDIAPKMAAHQDAIYLNPKLFKRVKTIYDSRASLKLDAEAARLVEYYYQHL